MSLLKLKKSSVVGKVPLVGDLEYGELALNYADGKLFYKNSSNDIKNFSGDMSVVVISTNTTATANTHYHVDATSVTLTLPASPSPGDTIGVSNESQTDTVIARNGNAIQGLADDLTLDIEDSYVELRYVEAGEGWRIVAQSTFQNYSQLNFDSDFAASNTDDLTEGSTNFYYTTTRANSAIDARVDKAFVDALNVDADTLDNQNGTYYLDYSNFTNTPSIPSAANNATITLTAGIGLSGGGDFTTDQSTNETVTFTVDLSELTDMTAAMVGTDEFIVLDNGASRRKAANEINLSIFNDDLGYSPIIGTDSDAVFAGAQVPATFTVTDGVIQTLTKRNLTLSDLGFTGDTNANNYVHPSYNGDDFSVDTGPLTGATVVSDIDINVTTDTLGHVTDANASVATRTLTLANLGYTGATDANNYTHPNHTGHVTSTGDGSTVLTVSAITGQTATSSLTSTDEIIVNDGGAIRRADISVLQSYMQDNLNVGIMPVVVTSTSVTAAANTHYHVDASSVTITLPASPTAGESVGISVENSTNTVISRNGSNIQGLADNLTIDIADSYVELRYVEAGEGWRIVAQSTFQNYTNLDFDSDLAAASTTDLSEGTNLYYTTTRANSAIDTRVNKAFVDALNVDADTLDNQNGTYYLDYNNFTNTPTPYTHPTHPGDDLSVDTGPLTGATVVSDIDINVTTDTLGHVTDANASVATRTLTLANLGYTGATDANNYVHPNHTGQVTSTGDGATVLTASAITAQTALTTGLASTDELMVSDAGVLKRMDVSVIEDYMQNNLAFVASLPSGTADQTLRYNGTTLEATSRLQIPATGPLIVDTGLSIEDGSGTFNPGPLIEMKRNSTSPAIGDLLGATYFYGKNTAAEDVLYGYMGSQIVASGNGVETGRLYFGVISGGSNVTALEIETDGLVQVKEALDVEGPFTSRGIEDNATSNAIAITSASNVGIGTASPNEKLDVNGAIQIRGGTAGFATTTSVGMLDFNSDGLRLLSFGANGTTRGTFKFYQAGQNNAIAQEAMRVTDTGQLFIGKTTAGSTAFKLWVTGGRSLFDNTDNYAIALAKNDVINGYIGGNGSSGIQISDIAGSSIATFNNSGSVTIATDLIINNLFGAQTISAATGDFGNIQVGTNNTGASWNGYSIDGQAVFMFNPTTNEGGIYNDVQNHWALKYTENAATELFFQGAGKLATKSNGVDITGRLDATNAVSGTTLTASTGGSVFNMLSTSTFENTTSGSALQVFQSNGANDAFMTFHISGAYAVHLGVDRTTNKLSVGGWSAGTARNVIFHQGETDFRHVGSANTNVLYGLASGGSYYSVQAASTTIQYHRWFLEEQGEVMRCTASAANLGTLYVNGDVQAFSTVVASDAKLKKNVVTLEDSLSKILKLRGVSYEWNELSKRDGKKDVGLIAQEVQAIIPELVSEVESKIEEDGHEAETHLAVSYDRLAGHFVEAFKQQQKQIDTLQEKLNALTR